MKPKFKVAIVTDSVAQVPQKIAQKLNIRVIPYTVFLDGKQYLDGIDLSADKLYKHMRISETLPKTAGPSIGQFLEIFRECLQEGAQTVLYIALSSKLSSAYNIALDAAKMAVADFPERKVHVFDSKQVAISQGFIAIEAARLAQTGASVDKVLERAKKVRQNVGFAAVLDTLKYLAAGGRIGKAAYLAGSVINVKPIISIGQDGIAAPVGVVRGSERAVKRIIKYVSERVSSCQSLHLATMQADAKELEEEMQKMALEKFDPVEFLNTDFTPVIGAHAGPGLVGLAYFYE